MGLRYSSNYSLAATPHALRLLSIFLVGSVLPIASVVERDRFCWSKRKPYSELIVWAECSTKEFAMETVLLATYLAQWLIAKGLCTKPGNSLILFTVEVRILFPFAISFW